MNLHHNVQQGAPINELVNQRDAVLKLRSFFANILSKRAATLAPQHNVASQTLSMIDALLAPVFPPGPMSRPAPPGSLPSLRDLLQTVAGKGLRPSSAGAPAAPQASTSAFDSLAYTPLTSRQGSVERYLGQDDLISSQANLLLPNMHTTHQQGTSMGEFDTMASTEALVGFLTGPTGCVAPPCAVARAKANTAITMEHQRRARLSRIGRTGRSLAVRSSSYMYTICPP